MKTFRFKCRVQQERGPLRQFMTGIQEGEVRSRRRETVRSGELPYLAGTPVSEASGSPRAMIVLFCEAHTSRLLILGLLALAASLASSLARAQTIFNCPSGFVSTLSASCGIGFSGVNGPGTFQVTGTPNGYPAVLSGSAVELAIPTANHIALNLNYWYQAVGDQAFVANYTFIPNGWNLSLVLNNNTNTIDGGSWFGQNFSGGAGCEGSFFQAFNDPNPYNPPNNLFALMLDEKSPLTDANAGNEGGAGGNTPFTYSSIQYYQQGQDPCNPRDGTEPYFYFTQKVSTSPVPLNSPTNSPNTTTGHDYSMTVTYTGTNLTAQLYDITAGGSCPGSSCFTYTWSNVSIPSLVGGTTAYVGLAGSTNAATGSPLLINSFSYTVLSAAATPAFPRVGAPMLERSR